jgi:pSer/pThr/pTyr-binding forkhead associated (FHA) protein
MFLSQLNSVHLANQPRRSVFRQARQVLLGALGDQTILAQSAGQKQVIMTHSISYSPQAGLPFPADCSYVLADRELVYPLKVGINTVGRFLDSDVFLCERAVSRRHCVVLIHTNGTCDLHDTASCNGTYLNGRRVTQPVAIRSGDRVRICDREFTFLSLAELELRRRTAIDNDTQLD